MTNETEYQRGYREGAEKMREDAGDFLSGMYAELMQQGFRDYAGSFIPVINEIRKLPITPPQPLPPAPKGEE